MQTIKPIYLIALAVVILLVIYIKVSNPYREYSTAQYWENATLESVAQIPDEALMPGNKNGPVIMWAAIGTNNTDIIQALYERGSDINESDGIFKGTPLTGAAGYSEYPEIIDRLIKLGADIHKKVHNNETALMIAAQYNENAGIATALVKHGAILSNKNKQGKTALDLAKLNNNITVINELEALNE